MKTKQKYINREITWLKFNARVLQEARDKDVPLLERLRFLGIYSNNLDEFYRVRYATVLRALEIDYKAYSNIISGQSLQTLLKEIQEVVALQQESYDNTYEQIMQELECENIHFIDENQLNENQKEYVSKLYRNKLRHTVAVYLWTPDEDRIPELKDAACYLAVKMTKKTKENMALSSFFKMKKWFKSAENNTTAQNSYAILEVPTHLFSRFVVLPQEDNKKFFMMLEDVIRFNLTKIFDIFEFDEIEAHSFKSSKDSELDLDHDVQKSFMDRISRSVEGRRSGEPVRLVHDREMANETLAYLKQILHIDKFDSVSPGGKYHNKRDFIGIPDMGREDLTYKKIKPLIPPALKDVVSYIKAVEEQDHLIYVPFVDYSVLLNFLREAAIDPRVEEIKMTVYRVANNSQVMSALINAAKNGKKVTTILELRARFDEANNVNWSKVLQDEGVNVIFGVADLKVHSKIGVVTYRVGEELKKISFISTGNFHEKTAKIYTDFTLMTSHKGITEEVDCIFDFFEANYKVKNYEHLMVSPFETRRKIYQMIEQEIQNKKNGLPAQINMKVNSLSDKGVIDKLYDAGQQGVEVRLVIRGICCLVPGIPGLSENIHAISVVDKFLEHPRIYWFKNGGEDKLFISSADLMARNIDHRVEVSCPIYDKQLKQEVMNTFDLSFNDNVKGRIQNATLDEIYQRNKLSPNRSQFTIYEYYKNLYETQKVSE